MKMKADQSLDVLSKELQSLHINIIIEKSRIEREKNKRKENMNSITKSLDTQCQIDSTGHAIIDSGRESMDENSEECVDKNNMSDHPERKPETMIPSVSEEIQEAAFRKRKSKTNKIFTQYWTIDL